MGLIDSFKKVVFENYANFSGRTRRQDYWYFVLCMFIINLIINILTIATAESGIAALISLISVAVSLGLAIPGIAVSIRRLHDVGKSGWWLLIGLVPLIGGIILLVWYCTAGQEGPNKWGPDPKNPDTENEVTKAFE